MGDESFVTRADVPVVRCSTCDTPFVLRLAFTFGEGGQEYLYQRDCKHKSTAVALNEPEFANLAAVRVPARESSDG